MELVKSVPITEINSEQLKQEFYGESYKFKITDVNLTEFDGNNQITVIEQKQSVNVTISGYINEPFKIGARMRDRIFNDDDYINGDSVDINGNNINLIFYGVRIIREKNVPSLLVDNVTELYGFLKPLYVNAGEMSVESEKNIFLTYKELVELLEGTTVNLGVNTVTNKHHSVQKWITKYKKGDTNGD